MSPNPWLVFQCNGVGFLNVFYPDLSVVIAFAEHSLQMSSVSCLHYSISKMYIPNTWSHEINSGFEFSFDSVDRMSWVMETCMSRRIKDFLNSEYKTLVL